MSHCIKYPTPRKMLARCEHYAEGAGNSFHKMFFVTLVATWLVGAVCSNRVFGLTKEEFCGAK